MVDINTRTSLSASSHVNGGKRFASAVSLITAVRVSSAWGPRWPPWARTRRGPWRAAPRRPDSDTPAPSWTRASAASPNASWPSRTSPRTCRAGGRRNRVSGRSRAQGESGIRTRSGRMGPVENWPSEFRGWREAGTNILFLMAQPNIIANRD